MTKGHRTSTLLSVLLCMVGSPLWAQVPADLQRAMQERDQAVDKVDAMTWDRLTAPNFTVVDATGTFLTKAQRLAELKTQKPAAPTTRERVQIEPYGNVFVRRFLSGGNWVLDVWLKDSAGWRVVAVQVTPAKK